MANLTTLKDFLVLCQTKNFSQAAEHCHVSISGLSRRIQGLEEWLGAPLFSRHKTTLEMTDAGQRLHAVATEVVYAMEGLRKSLRADRGVDALRIRFAAPHIMSGVFFPHWIPRLHEDFREAKFSVDSDNLSACFALLDEDKVDYVVALFDAHDTVTSRLGLCAQEYLCLDLGDEQLMPVSAPNATGLPLFNLHTSADLPLSFLDYAQECHLGWSLHPALQQHHLNLQRNHSASLTEGLRFMALSKLGIAWLPHTLIRDDLGAKRLVRAGEARFDVPLRFKLFRRAAPLGHQAERLWNYLSALASQPPAQMAATAALSELAIV